MSDAEDTVVSEYRVEYSWVGGDVGWLKREWRHGKLVPYEEPDEDWEWDD